MSGVWRCLLWDKQGHHSTLLFCITDVCAGEWVHPQVNMDRPLKSIAVVVAMLVLGLVVSVVAGKAAALCALCLVLSAITTGG